MSNLNPRPKGLHSGHASKATQADRMNLSLQFALYSALAWPPAMSCSQNTPMDGVYDFTEFTLDQLQLTIRHRKDLVTSVQQFLPQRPLCNTLRLQPRKPVSFILEQASESLHCQNTFSHIAKASTREDPVALKPLNSPLNKLPAPMALGPITDPASFTHKGQPFFSDFFKKNVLGVQMRFLMFLALSTGITDANVIDRPILETHWPKRFPRK